MPEGKNQMSKPLTKKQLLKLRDIYLANFNKGPLPDGGLPEAWYQVICTFLKYEGHDIVPEEIRILEATVADKGLSEDYIEVLMSVTKTPEDPEGGDADKILHILSASPEERLQALRFVLAV
jgi:hypothetical protein